jgi:hypothetical protein
VRYSYQSSKGGAGHEPILELGLWRISYLKFGSYVPQRDLNVQRVIHLSYSSTTFLKGFRCFGVQTFGKIIEEQWRVSSKKWFSYLYGQLLACLMEMQGQTNLYCST